MCTFCNHVGKDFPKLCTHFLNKHEFILEQWIEEDLGKLEDETMAKAEADRVKADADHEFSEEEIIETETEDKDLKKEPAGDSAFITSLRTMFVQDNDNNDGGDTTESPPKKKRRVLKKFKSLETLKDFIEPILDESAKKYLQPYHNHTPKNR